MDKAEIMYMGLEFTQVCTVLTLFVVKNYILSIDVAVFDFLQNLELSHFQPPYIQAKKLLKKEKKMDAFMFV